MKALAGSSKAQKLGIESLQRNITVHDELGIFCLTEAATCDQMWREYAGNGTGFVIGFDTGHAGFELLKTPGRLGKVSYSDAPFGSALGTLLNEDAAGAIFRKRMRYAFEREWRSIRMLRRLECCARGAFLSAFDPASVREIIIRPDSSVKMDLQRLLATDDRYQHVKIIDQGG